MDARAMEFNENNFDAILDKAAFDSVLVKYQLMYSAAKTQLSTRTK